jgi:hypothetical protein
VAAGPGGAIHGWIYDLQDGLLKPRYWDIKATVGPVSQFTDLDLSPQGETGLKPRVSDSGMRASADVTIFIFVDEEPGLGHVRVATSQATCRLQIRLNGHNRVTRGL